MSDLKDYVIGDGVLIKYLGKGGMVVIPEGVTHIKADAFMESGIQVTTIVLPESLQHSEKSLFWMRKSLRRIEAPSKKIYNLVYNNLNLKQKTAILLKALKDRDADPNVISKIIANKKSLIAHAVKNDDEPTVEYILSLLKTVTMEQLDEFIEMCKASPRFRIYFINYKNRLYPPEVQDRKLEKQLQKELDLL